MYQSACEPAVLFSNRMPSVSSVSGVLGIMEQIESKLLHFIFGVAELILTFVSVVDAVVGGHFDSWMIFCFSLSFFLRGGERVVNHPGELLLAQSCSWAC